MISRTAEYALRAMVVLADEPNTSLTTRELAARTRVPRGYLSKVLLSLVRAELIESQRGLHGGFLITRPPREISALDVVSAVDPIPRIRRCPLGIGSHGDRLCALHRKLDRTVAQAEKALASCTLATLIREKVQNEPLCSTDEPERRPSRRSRRLRTSAR